MSEGSARLIYFNVLMSIFPLNHLPTSVCCLHCVQYTLYFSGAQSRGGGNAWTTSPRNLFVLAWENGSEYFLMEASEVEIL